VERLPFLIFADKNRRVSLNPFLGDLYIVTPSGKTGKQAERDGKSMTSTNKASAWLC
jgi:hypothetical protein